MTGGGNLAAWPHGAGFYVAIGYPIAGKIIELAQLWRGLGDGHLGRGIETGNEKSSTARHVMERIILRID